MPELIVKPEGWGSSQLQDIRAIARSVCAIFLDAAGIGVADTIVIRYSAVHGPRVLLERGSGNEHLVLLNTRDRRWAQLAFQFAHEYCHIFMAHFRTPLQHPFQWIEESLCEMASLYALLRMGSCWQANPPYPNWASYSDSLTRYARDRINAVETFERANEFRIWLDSNIARMSSDSLVRALNNVVAVHLLDYFIDSPDAWRAVADINANPNLSGDLSQYFSAWAQGTEGCHHVARIATLMGIPTGIAI